MKQGVFDKPPVKDDNERGSGGASALDILHDIIWNEIDVHFSKYDLILYNIKMDLESNKKYIKKNTDNPEFNLDFIQNAKVIKLLLAIPLKIDISKIWLKHYQIIDSKSHKNMYNIKASLTFENQLKMSNEQLSFQINKILHELFPRDVKLETIKSNENGEDESNDHDELVEDAKTDYDDQDPDTLGISFGKVRKYNSGAISTKIMNNFELMIIFSISIFFIVV